MSRRTTSAGRVRALLALAAALAVLATPARAQTTIDGRHFGPVRLAVPDGDVRGYVVVISDASGWSATDDKALDLLRRDGALAAGVDLPAYLAKLGDVMSGPKAPACLRFVNDIEGLSKQLQRLHPAATYAFPILAGVGAGGALAYAALAQAPANTVAGAVSLDPATSLATPGPLCVPGGVAPLDEAGRSVPVAAPAIPGFWDVALDARATPRARDRVANLEAEGVPLDRREVAGVDRATDLASLVAPHLTQATRGGTAALPLVELPADKPSRLLAVVLSGDGGWRDIDKAIAESLRSKGVSVVGWDSLRYFWWKKTPDQTAADLAEVLREYGAKWGAERFALIGYSFGADVLPALYDRLPAALRERIALVSLLGVESKADWEIRVTGWLGAPPGPDAVPIAPDLARIPPRDLQCFYGAEGKRLRLSDLSASAAELIETTGGHHFGHGYAALAQDILVGFEKRAAP